MKIRLKYDCQEILFALKAATAPEYLLVARGKHQARQKRLARGFPYSITEADYYELCSLWDQIVWNHVSVEANSAWLDDASLVKTISVVISPRKQDFHCGFDSAGNLSIRCSVVLEVAFRKKISRPDFAAWSVKNNLPAMFRVKVDGLGEGEVLKKVAQVGLWPPAGGPRHPPAASAQEKLVVSGGGPPCARREARRITIRFAMSKGSGTFPDYASWPEEKRNLDYLDSCLTFCGDFSFIEDKIESWRLLDPGFESFVFEEDRLSGHPRPIVEFRLRDSVRRLDKSEFLASACDASYRLEIPGVNGDDPWYFEDHNGYSEIIYNRVPGLPPWQGGNAGANAEKCLAKIQQILTDIIRKNRRSLRAAGDSKVSCYEFEEPFDLAVQSDSRRRGLRELIHWIMYFEEMYQLFLTEPQYASCLGAEWRRGNYPMGRTAADRSARALLDKMYRRCIQHVNAEFKNLLGRRNGKAARPLQGAAQFAARR